MIIGLGNDLSDISRIGAVLNKYGERFTKRCFTEIERQKSDARSLRAASYAKRFAAKEACAKALAAVKDAQKRLGVLNDERRAAGEQPLDFGIALHVGDVMFGNIGSPERIEFTVIGTAANEAARIEGLCKKLKIQVLVSAAFAGHYPGKLDTVGRHVLEGHEGTCELFTLEGGGESSDSNK